MTTHRYRPRNQFDAFTFDTDDGFRARVIPATSAEKNVAFLTVTWDEGELRHQWIGELTPAHLNWALHPEGMTLTGTMVTWVPGQKTRERIPATFRLRTNMKTWSNVVGELHRAWGADRGTSSPLSALNWGVGHAPEEQATAQLYYRAIDWVRGETARGASVTRLKKMVKLDARNPAGPDPEDIRARTTVVFYFEKGRSLDEIETEVSQVYGPRTA